MISSLIEWAQVISIGAVLLVFWRREFIDAVHVTAGIYAFIGILEFLYIRGNHYGIFWSLVGSIVLISGFICVSSTVTKAVAKEYSKDDAELQELRRMESGICNGIFDEKGFQDKRGRLWVLKANSA